ncbi:cysteine peptidase family C39 domain-containing protein [Microcoleus sp. C2C3]
MFIRLYSLFILPNVKEHSFDQKNSFLRTSKQVDEISGFQQSEEDCGAACLASIAQFYGQNFTISCLRELVGTGLQGTTLLGLKQVRNIPEMAQHYPK